ncbi:hypothetical protein CMQ_7353 [Grosmannia clavigera kw1407]|uniref:Uncharacterized protein n=1 Tax=Grosmannia clavigera (strain kw1407 / UAMH 11150) TaxID=655863 RepID=F0XQF7_GROCL|nr:uncharacterized protein CMQ_7353 [Grosmannia clavigera kw1407]EFX00351.1 hypothetical protein CMQ_7353 [Grosmannia clavigera kw1407]
MWWCILRSRVGDTWTRYGALLYLQCTHPRKALPASGKPKWQYTRKERIMLASTYRYLEVNVTLYQQKRVSRSRRPESQLETRRHYEQYEVLRT